MDELIVNRITESFLTSIDLEDFFPKEEILLLDLKQFLFRELILKEKDFREALKNLDWQVYKNRLVAVTCSTDAIVPRWAFMLVAVYLQPVAKDIFYGSVSSFKNELLLGNIKSLPVEHFIDKRIVVKGCGDLGIGEAAYLEITKKLRPIVKSIMYGEPCSTVPIFKKK